MAYTRRRASRPARRSYGRSTGYSRTRRAPVRRRASARRGSARSGGGRTIRLVIETATPAAQTPEAMMLPQVQSTTRKAKF